MEAISPRVKIPDVINCGDGEVFNIKVKIGEG
jgi:hypothetical protein